MSVEFITGRPGGGKSMLAVRMICEELAHGKRYVATNIQLKFGELQEFLDKNWPKNDCIVGDRVRILNVQETMEFWSYPAPQLECGKERQMWESRDGRKLNVPNFDDYPKTGTMFVIDECHIPFGSRSYYKSNSTDGFFYLSQHEKYGHTVLLVTQHCENVDKQFRSVAQSYTEVRNGYRERWPILGGIIKARPGFTSKEYPNPPGAVSQVATFTKRWKLDAAGLAQCYNTLGGMGVVSQAAERVDGSRKPVGLPWWSLVVAAAIACFIISYIPEALAAGASKLWGDARERFTGQPGTPAPVAKPQVVSPAPAQPGVALFPKILRNIDTAPNHPERKISSVEEPEVKLVGWAGTGKTMLVYLSDGDCIDIKTDKRWQGFVGRDAVQIDGKIYRGKGVSLPQR